YNRNITEVLSNLAESAGYDYDYLCQMANRLAGKKITRINLRRFSGFHPAMQRLILRLAVAKIKGDTRRLTFKHIKELEDLILNRPVNSIVDLPKGVSVKKQKESIVFYQK
ncbi:MAG: hypothetical protein NC928_05370, partial [Candidatus Omnitrophica bacterium]|nr:hypothetical protein [Candidatus Omnitrophota bacterium]